LKLKNYCKKKKYKFFLSNNIKLAVRLDLDGAYIPSFNKNKQHLSFSFKKKFLIIGSAHSNKEIKIKENQKVEILFLSSLFKKNKNYLGINKFKLLSQLSAKKIIALGGISSVNLKKLKLLNCFGFAGISYFE
jgi:thiamine-phosphate pyrophosphorylase